MGAQTRRAAVTAHEAWPALDAASWAPTKRSLHAYAQMLGKLRLALAPHQPNFLFTSLAMTPRGFSTGIMPLGSRTIAATLDVFDATIVLQTSDGGERRIALHAPRTIAGVFADLHAALDALGANVRLSPIPQEVPDVTPFDRDERPADFDTSDARRWLTVASATHDVFDRWRAHFAGRMGLQLWWGAFDLSLMLFNGRPAAAPTNRGYLLRYDLDAELLNVGFYPGDAANAPFFYGYVYPQPAACASMKLAPSEAAWSDALGEWVLPYDAVRASPNPQATLVAFLDALYGVCGSAAGWDRTAFSYVPPPLRAASISMPATTPTAG